MQWSPHSGPQCNTPNLGAAGSQGILMWTGSFAPLLDDSGAAGAYPIFTVHYRSTKQLPTQVASIGDTALVAVDATAQRAVREGATSVFNRGAVCCFSQTRPDSTTATTQRSSSLHGLQHTILLGLFQTQSDGTQCARTRRSSQAWRGIMHQKHQ